MNRSYPNIRQSFGLFGLYVIITIVLGLGVSAIPGIPISLITLVGTVVAMVAIIAIALYLKKTNTQYLFTRLSAASPTAYGVAALFILFLIFVLDPLTSLIPMPEQIRRMFEEALRADIYTFVAVAIAAPVLEELLFRKIMLEGLEVNYGPKKAIIWSAALFAIFHLNPWQGIGAFFAGLFLGWLYVNTRDIWLCIFVHFFNNTLSFIAFIAFDDPFYSMIDATGGDYYTLAAIIAISLVALYFCFRILKRHFELKRPEASSVIDDDYT